MKRIIIPIVILVTAAALLFGCGQPKPFKYHSGNEIPEGEGIFTKEAGSFTIYDSKQNASVADKAPAEVTGMNSTPGALDAAASSADEAEFREFQQWRKERKDFEAFQQWKKTRQNAAEYEEFREWQRWQAFKKWQESQPKGR
jgi:hypothetical protein